jgi:cytochrome c-type biogenesis protein
MPLDLLGVFVAGLVTFVTPCVLPLVPVYLAALVGGGASADEGSPGRGRLLWRASLFSAGFILVFTLFGLTATVTGSFLSDHRSAVQLIGALFILFFGLHLLGALRLPWLERVVRADERRWSTRFGSVNAVVMGVVFAAGWSPCVGPVLGSVLTYTASRTADPWVGSGYLAVYGFGFAVPLLATAALAEAASRWLRRIRPHLHRVERAVGALLLIVSVSMMLGAVPGLSGEDDSEPALVTDDSGRRMPTMVAMVSSDCPYCERMKPLVEAMTSRCDGRNVRLVTRDVSLDEHRHLVRRHRLVGLPTFLFLDDEGREVARLVGVQSERTLLQHLSALRGESCDGVGALPGEGAPADPAMRARPGVGSEPAAGESCTRAPPLPAARESVETPACGTGDP